MLNSSSPAETVIQNAVPFLAKFPSVKLRTAKNKIGMERVNDSLTPQTMSRRPTVGDCKASSGLWFA